MKPPWLIPLFPNRSLVLREHGLGILKKVLFKRNPEKTGDIKLDFQR